MAHNLIRLSDRLFINFDNVNFINFIEMNNYVGGSNKRPMINFIGQRATHDGLVIWEDEEIAALNILLDISREKGLG